MIVSFGTKATADFHAGERVKAFESVERPARIKLDRLDLADSLAELAALPGNRLEALKGNRQGQYSIRINGQWRVCFRWDDEKRGPADVEIVDYH